MSKVHAAIALALLALSLIALPFGIKAQEGAIQVMDHKCDKNGGVTALLLFAAAPGPVAIQWDNKVVCGTQS